MTYLCRVKSPDAMVRQIVTYSSSPGPHYFYFTGVIPAKRDRDDFDGVMIDTYGVDVTAWTRCRHRKRGRASVHYLRCNDYFILMASHVGEGSGPFNDQLGERWDPVGARHHARQYRDLRRETLCYDAYAIRSTECQNTRVVRGQRRAHPKRHTLVRLNKEVYEGLRDYMLDAALRRSKPYLEHQFWSLGFYPYRPVANQFYTILRAVNRRRQGRGFEPLDHARCIRRFKRSEPAYITGESPITAWGSTGLSTAEG